MTDGDAAAEPLAFETGELPGPGEHNRLVLMAVDPYLIHAYWNISAKRADAAKALFDDDEPEAYVLRFRDATGIDFDGVNCRSSFDVDIRLDAGKWYVRLWSPERRYCADIGLRGKDGRLVALARSNMVETPPDWPRVRVDDAAALVEQGDPEGAAAGPEAAPVDASAATAGADSREVLDRKLAEVAELRDEPLADAWEPQANGAVHADLTEANEKSFTPGISSVILGKRRPGK